MNGKLLISLFAGLLLAGGAVAEDTAECIKIDVAGSKCDGDRKYPIVTINTERANLDRINVCAARGSTIEFRVVPPARNYVGSVAVRAKVAKDTWLLGTNSPDARKIEILVPGWLDNNTDYDYTIFLPNDICIDPRIHVED